MASNPRKRQQKLERKAAKRKEKKHELARRDNASLAQRFSDAARYPVLDTLVSEDLWSQGLGWVLFSRRLGDGSIALAVFLVDRYCLGVKNALADIIDKSTYDAEFLRKMHKQFTSRTVTPASARKIVEDAAAYAQELGLPPHVDYHKAKLIFGDVNAADGTEVTEFGKDGKPFFIAGPTDTPARIRHIMGVLNDNLGSGGFHYTIPVTGSEQIRIVPGAEDDFFDEEDEEYLPS